MDNQLFLLANNRFHVKPVDNLILKTSELAAQPDYVLEKNIVDIILNLVIKCT